MTDLQKFTEIESPYFQTIIDLMFHSQKEQGIAFLRTLDNIINYALSVKIENNDINYQIIHLPNCPDWARQLLVRFVIHKISLTSNQENINRLKNSIVTTIISNDKKVCTEIQQKNSYLRRVRNLTRDLQLPNSQIRSIVLVKEQDLLTTKVDKNPYLTEHYTSSLNKKDHNLTLFTSETTFDIEKAIKKINENEIPIFKNLFLFHSKNRSKITNSYNHNQLKRLNQYGLGIENCVVFSFSSEPIKLYNTIHNIKYTLASSLLNKRITKYDDFDGFITFTTSELDFVFQTNTKEKQIREIIDAQDRELFSTDIEYNLGQFNSNLFYRGLLSLAFTNTIQEQFLSTIKKEEPEVIIEDITTYLKYLQQVLQSQVIPTIMNFIEGSASVGFILPPNASKEVQTMLSILFGKYNRQINFYTFKDFSKTILSERIIVLDYKYTNSYYKTYPNSYDLLPINKKQTALILINRVTHNSFYEWNKYWYDRDYNGLLYSKFRKEIMGWEKKIYQKPTTTTDINYYIEEAESESRQYHTEKCRIFYTENAKPKEYFACERALYVKDGSYRISELKDIGDETTNIQMLDDLIEQTKLLISKKNKGNSNAELLLRQDQKYNLTEQEINSTDELWKILLRKQVKNFGEESVYNDIFKDVPKEERISINSFSQWYSSNNNIILPRSKKHQKILLLYLGFQLKSIYHKIIIAKKISNIKNSRFLNNSIEQLLHRILLEPTTENLYKKLADTYTDIFALLEVDSLDDFLSLIDLLKVEIKLTPIEKIEYD